MALTLSRRSFYALCFCYFWLSKSLNNTYNFISPDSSQHRASIGSVFNSTFSTHGTLNWYIFSCKNVLSSAIYVNILLRRHTWSHANNRFMDMTKIFNCKASMRNQLTAASICLILLAGDISRNPGPDCSQLNTLPIALACRSQPQLNTLYIGDFKTIQTPGDGHCFIHAVQLSIAEYLKIHMPYSNLCQLINNEFSRYDSIYLSRFNGEPFDYYYQIECYFRLKSYNSNVVDLIPAAAANALRIRIVIITDYARNFQDCPSFTPSDYQETFPYIVLHLHAEHYSATSYIQRAGRPTDSSPPSLENAVMQDVTQTINIASPPAYMQVNNTSFSYSDIKDKATDDNKSPVGISVTQNLSLSQASSTYCFDGDWSFLPNDLTILHCNCQSLLESARGHHHGYHNKIDYLRYLLQLPKAPLVVCISETKLSSKITDNEINIPGYTIFRRDRNRNGGGVAIFCHSSLNPRLLTDISVSNIELIKIKISPPRSKSMAIVCCYRPPSAPSTWVQSFMAITSKILSLHQTIVINGDFNIDLLQSSSFSDELSVDFDLRQHIRRPTCVAKNSCTLIDHIYTYNTDVTYADACNLHIADHFATLCSISCYSAGSGNSLPHRLRTFRS